MTSPALGAGPRPAGSPLIACLPMYDWPHLAAAHDSLWALIRDRLAAEGIDAPQTLDREIGLWDAWESPDLLLAQTCGLPYRTRLHGRVSLIGTPDYGLPETQAGYYRSVLVTRRGEASEVSGYRDRVLACNGYDSQSGWAAPQNHAADLGFQFTDTRKTGAHRASAGAVAEGQADIAAIDAVTWRIMKTAMPEITGALQVIGVTAATPALPLVTARDRDPAPVASAVAWAIASLPPGHRAALGLRGLIRLPAQAYLAVPTPPPPAPGTPANT